MPETVKAIKLYAVEHDLKVYEVVELALDHLLNQKLSASPQTDLSLSGQTRK
jgi:hypothetical protein